MFVSKKKYMAKEAELESVLINYNRLVQTNKDLVKTLNQKESEISRLNEKLRQLGKKPFKK